jgi:hypothetical protein
MPSSNIKAMLGGKDSVGGNAGGKVLLKSVGAANRGCFRPKGEMGGLAAINKVETFKTSEHELSRKNKENIESMPNTVQSEPVRVNARLIEVEHSPSEGCFFA